MHFPPSTATTVTGLLLASLLTTTTAIAPNTQSCHAVDGEVNNAGDVFNDLFSDLIHATWHVDVGEPFRNGGGCGAISNSLKGAVTEFDNFQCTDDGAGGTNIEFSGLGSTGVGGKINAALTKVFPPIDGGFNCPDS